MPSGADLWGEVVGDRAEITEVRRGAAAERAGLRSGMVVTEIDGRAIAGVDIRGMLRALGVDPGARRLAELGPPQKSLRLNRGGRTLQITTAMLIQGSCGIYIRPSTTTGSRLKYSDVSRLFSSRPWGRRRSRRRDATRRYRRHDRRE